MRNQNRFYFAVGDCLQVRQRLFASVLWVHSAIEHQTVTSNLQIVGIRSDLCLPREINEFQMRMLLQTFDCYQRRNSLNSRFAEQSNHCFYENGIRSAARAKQ